MRAKTKTTDTYQGFEQGPIRPPSEARSLLIRITRNCPWNRCTFCPVYKGTKFSIRPVEHVKRDIDSVHEHVEMLLGVTDASGRIPIETARELAGNTALEDHQAFTAALHWVHAGRMKSVFLQDANSLVVKTDHLVEILTHLKSRFPSVERTTSYARSQTIASKKEDELRAIREAGLDRIHIGLESGCDQVLAMVKKGVTKEQHILAGLKAKKAGMELSEYVMPGLGGRQLSEKHAVETADALNQIDPDFIRIRTLAVPPHAPLFDDYQAGRFARCTDVMVAQELLTLIEGLEGITSVVKSDHILNLFDDLKGKLPDDKERMLGLLRVFLAMDPQRQRLYQVGRRLGILRRLGDLDDPDRLAEAEKTCHMLGITTENVDEIAHQLMTRYL
ncbi:MAG: radical SAM protein [Phycisphaerales bacterium]|nr:MAG: radical SAM protein [Phycisphaerales bacterium]